MSQATFETHPHASNMTLEKHDNDVHSGLNTRTASDAEMTFDPDKDTAGLPTIADDVEMKAAGPPAGGLPPDHPMHPSQWSGVCRLSFPACLFCLHYHIE
jgi:hypothetical protein